MREIYYKWYTNIKCSQAKGCFPSTTLYFSKITALKPSNTSNINALSKMPLSWNVVHHNMNTNGVKMPQGRREINNLSIVNIQFVT